MRSSVGSAHRLIFRISAKCFVVLSGLYFFVDAFRFISVQSSIISICYGGSLHLTFFYAELFREDNYSITNTADKTAMVCVVPWKPFIDPHCSKTAFKC